VAILLKETAAESVRASLAAIDAALARCSAPHPSLAGDASVALLFAYRGLAGAPAGQDAAVAWLDAAIDAVSKTRARPDLFGGFCGVAWTAAHLQGMGLLYPEEDPCAAIDEALLAYVEKGPWHGQYDLISGLAGYAVYGLERLPRPVALATLEHIVDCLDELAEWSGEGATWHTPPELLLPLQRALAPEGYHNLGLAHGVPGVIAVLGQIAAAGVAREKAERLLEGAARWLLAQEISGQDAGFAWIAEEKTPARSAWCYGDPGVAAALFVAARAVGNEVWEREAIRIALRAAARDPARAGVVDPGLCHGSAGLAHIFNRFFQATGDEQFADAARVWFERTLAFRRPGEGVGGFSSWKGAFDGRAARWEPDPGFLTGAAGIGLALLAAVSDVPPDWDRVLLLSSKLGAP
jgi:lantibiotic modifying enzyme